MNPHIAYIPMRLKQLENAAYQIATTGQPVLIRDDDGHWVYLGECDLARLRQQIVHLQQHDRMLHGYL